LHHTRCLVLTGNLVPLLLGVLQERPRKRVNRNQLAQELFKNLEKKDGRITKVMPATITSADTLAQADLKDLGGKKDAAAKPQPAAKK